MGFVGISMPPLARMMMVTMTVTTMMAAANPERAGSSVRRKKASGVVVVAATVDDHDHRHGVHHHAGVGDHPYRHDDQDGHMAVLAARCGLVDQGRPRFYEALVQRCIGLFEAVGTVRIQELPPRKQFAVSG